MAAPAAGGEEGGSSQGPLPPWDVSRALGGRCGYEHRRSQVN